MNLQFTLAPLARDIASFLSQTGGHAGQCWAGYDGRNEGLDPLISGQSDILEYSRSRNREARIRFENVRMVDPAEVFFRDPYPAEEKVVSGRSKEYTNESQDPHTLTFTKRDFPLGETEWQAVSEAWRNKDGGFPLSTSFNDILYEQWKLGAGMDKETTIGGDFPLIVQPGRYVKAQLQWFERQWQRRTWAFGKYDMGVTLGKLIRSRRFNRETSQYEWCEIWEKGSPIHWNSLDHLIAVAEQRGKPGWARYKHYQNRRLDPVFHAPDQREPAGQNRQSDQALPSDRPYPFAYPGNPRTGPSKRAGEIICELDTSQNEHRNRLRRLRSRRQLSLTFGAGEQARAKRLEKQFQAQVITLAQLNGWMHYHTYLSKRSPHGFPDLVLVRGERVIFAELKSQYGRLRQDQRKWLEALTPTGNEVYLWRPSDFPEIEKILSR